MPNINLRLLKLFQHTGLADTAPASSNPVLNWVDRAHFRHLLLSAPIASLVEPFNIMREGFSSDWLPAEEKELLIVEQQLGRLVDGLVQEIVEASGRSKFSLPFNGTDPLWRRLAFATMLKLEEEHKTSGKSVVMLNEIVVKIALMVDGQGGVERLERYVKAHGYKSAAADETTIPIGTDEGSSIRPS